jgi:hypothetical protein
LPDALPQHRQKERMRGRVSWCDHDREGNADLSGTVSFL